MLQPNSLANPLSGAEYSVFLSSSTYSGLFGVVTFTFDIESYSASGKFIRKYQVVKDVEQKVDKCYIMDEFVRAVYQENRFYIGLVGNNARFAKPCDPSLVFEEDDKFEVKFQIDNMTIDIPKDNFIMERDMTKYLIMNPNKQKFTGEAEFTIWKEQPKLIKTQILDLGSCIFEESSTSLSKVGNDIILNWASTSCNTSNLPPKEYAQLTWGPGDDEFCSFYEAQNTTWKSNCWFFD